MGLALHVCIAACPGHSLIACPEPVSPEPASPCLPGWLTVWPELARHAAYAVAGMPLVWPGIALPGFARPGMAGWIMRGCACRAGSDIVELSDDRLQTN